MDLAAGFPSITRSEWRALALEVLRRSGVEASSPEEALSSPTYDGLTLRPLYDSADLPEPHELPPFRRTARGSTAWDVRQRHAEPDAGALLDDLASGVTSLWLVVGDDAIPVGRLAEMLEDVYLDLAPIVLSAGEHTREAAEVLFELAAARGTPVTGNLGATTVTGEVVELARRCAAEFPGLRAVTVDGTPFHDAGGGDADELGCSLALGVQHLRALTGAGLTAQQAYDQMEFRYAVTGDQFATIAKLRAARKLWARVGEVIGAAGPQVQHAVTSSAMMTARDPWVNMLRTTVACFAAGVGGADAVTVQPFDACLGPPDAFSRRIARNTQSLLLEESGAGRVSDPAGGSWYVERRTADLAGRAWAWFQEIEAAGGPLAARELVDSRVAATRARRDDDIAHRRFPITGVSEFPDIDEKPPRRRPAPAEGPPGVAVPPGERPAGARREAGGSGEAPVGAGAGVAGGVARYAAGFEALRDLADAQPERPVVFLATIGPVAAYTARAAFAANLFQAGGFATETAGPGADPEQIATAFAVSGSTVACLCSSDKLYARHAEAVAAALTRAGARKVWLAGQGEYAGVDANLHTGCDALAVLRTTFDDLEVTR